MMTGVQRGNLGIVYDLISDVFVEVKSPNPLIVLDPIKWQNTVSGRLESALELLRDIAEQEESDEH